MNMNLLPIKVGKVEVPHLAWAQGLTVSLPSYLFEHLQTYYDKDELYIRSEIFNPETAQLAKCALEDVRLCAIFTNQPPISSRLSINYQKIPAGLRDIVAKIIGRIKRRQVSSWAKFPSWPLDLSADFIADIARPRHFSVNQLTPVLLTHDLDSPEGLKNAVNDFLDIEEAVGARSCHYIVPSSWPIHPDLLIEIHQRGHEVGIHGFDHSNKTPFLTIEERQQRLASANTLINQYNIYGYRAPSLLRTKGLLQDLSKFYRYDSSIPTSGGLFPVPNNGCASARPFQLEGIWEIPLSMPRDGSLLFLGYSYKEILETWIHSANLIAQSGGVVNLLTHCENRFSGKPSMRKIYQEFLEYLSHSGKFQFMLPKDLYLKIEEAEHGKCCV